MSLQNLQTDEGLRTAVEAIGPYQAWSEPGRQWVLGLAETIRWVQSADEDTRRTYEFQQQLWEDNHVAAVGQGNVPIENALRDDNFRAWVAKASMTPLPGTMEQQTQFLSNLYREIKQQLTPFTGRVPHLKIFRVLAALYPDAMTTIASTGALWQLVRAMGTESDLEAAQRHVWVRERLRAAVGAEADDAVAKAERMAIPWLLYDRYVKVPDRRTEESQPGTETSLLPLPAARRRRGLTAIKGLFPAVLSTLEFMRDGVTREQLIAFLRSTSPDVKVSSLGVTINSYLGELDVIRLEGDRYVPTERGENVLESQDPSYLADWLLTRILGIDRAVVDLRDKGPLPVPDLVSSIRQSNPNLTSNFIPQAMISWLRSFGVVRITPSGNYELTEIGRQWGSRIHWVPESLPAEPDTETILLAPVSSTGDASTGIVTPSVREIVASVQSAGHFSADLIARLHAGLWAHPRRHFAVLTGLSGAGKTLLAREYARALSPADVGRRLFTVPVQPGWYDPGALLGFSNPLQGESYVRTGFLLFLIAAANDPITPYVAVLDEMNLSHPEQYMAPLLSAMETGDSIRLHNEGDSFDGIPGEIEYPNNLVLIGTVNMDETTHGLSDKVLDRSFVIDFWDIDLSAYPAWGKTGINPAQELRTRKLLEGLLDALAPARLHFGWRVVDEVLGFVRRAGDASEVLSFDSALDGVIYAKVLPKLRGEDSPRFRDALKNCEKVLSQFGLARSQERVHELIQDLDRSGTARFWR